jgi:hypothetical protein
MSISDGTKIEAESYLLDMGVWSVLTVSLGTTKRFTGRIELVCAEATK